jgi:hypothetical protein
MTKKIDKKSGGKIGKNNIGEHEKRPTEKKIV